MWSSYRSGVEETTSFQSNPDHSDSYVFATVFRKPRLNINDPKLATHDESASEKKTEHLHQLTSEHILKTWRRQSYVFTVNIH